MDACSGHIVESIQWIEMKLGLKIDGSERKGYAQEIFPCILTKLSPLNPFSILSLWMPVWAISWKAQKGMK